MDIEIKCDTFTITVQAAAKGFVTYERSWRRVSECAAILMIRLEPCDRLSSLEIVATGEIRQHVPGKSF